MTFKPSEIDEFYRVGWIVVPSLFSMEEIEKIKEAFVRLQNTAFQLKTSQIYKDASFVLDQHPSKGVIIKRVVWAGGAEPELLKVGQDPRLLNRVADLFGINEFDQLLNQAHFKNPGDGVAFPWHQDIQHRNKTQNDWIDVDGRGSYVQTLLAVDHADESSGPLKFVKGSSQWGRLPLGSGDYEDPHPSPEWFSQTQTETLLMNPGDVAFFGPFTIHGSEPNVSRGPRRVLINGYAYPGANHRNYPGSGKGVRLKVSKA